MNEFFEKHPEIKKYGPWIVGGVVGLYLIYRYMNGSSSTAATTGNSNSDYASAVAAQSQYQAQAAQTALAQQTESDQANEANAQLNAQLTATEQQNEVAGVSAIGSTLSSIIGAEDQLPAAAINAASAQNQAALESAAGVAAAGLNAIPGTIQGAGEVLAASYSPLDAYGSAVANSGSIQAINSFGSNVSQMTQAAGAVASTSDQAASQREMEQSQEMGSLLTVAAIAAA